MNEARRERYADIAFAVVVMAVGAFFFTEAQKLPPSRFDPLGPGSFPLAISALLFVLGAIALAVTLLGGNIGRAETSLIVGLNGEDDSHRRRPLLAAATFLAVVAYAVVLQLAPVDFFTATAVLVAVLGILMGPRTPKAIAVSIAVGIGTSAFLTFIFGQFLRLLLP